MNIVHRVLAVSLAGAGCSLHRTEPDRPPAIAARAAFTEQAATALSESPVGPWWTGLGDARLDDLMRAALAANLDLRQYVHRVEEADALLRRAGGERLPSVDGVASYDVERERSETAESAAIGARLSWEIDVWGRLRSARDAARSEAEATRDDLDDVRLVLTTAVAETYYEIAEQQLQLALLDEQIRVNETLLELTRLRFGQGQSSIVAVLQQREQLAATRALAPSVAARLRRLEYAMDVLLGHAPGEGPRWRGALDPPAPLAAVGVPSDLLEQRPDLRAARRRLESLDARIGEAIADRLPRFRVGLSADGVGSPGIERTLLAAFADALLPLFDGGVRRAEVAARRARLDQAIAEYSHAYLVAVRDVESALSDEARQAERVELLERQLVVAKDLLTETRNHYSQGLTDYLPVLSAIVTVQELERELITNRRERLSVRIAIHRSVGGAVDSDTGASASEEAGA